MLTVINRTTGKQSEVTKSQLQNMIKDMDEDFYTSMFTSHTVESDGTIYVVIGGDDT